MRYLVTAMSSSTGSRNLVTVVSLLAWLRNLVTEVSLPVFMNLVTEVSLMAGPSRNLVTVTSFAF